MRLGLLLLCLCVASAQARPLEVPTYEELQKRADVVLVLRVKAITPRQTKPSEGIDTTFYRGYTAACSVLAVLKGSFDGKELSIPFFQHPQALPGFNGAVAAPFSLEESLAYLAFMKRADNGQLTPVTGNYDAGLSIKMMFDRWPDPRHVKLPVEPSGRGEQGGAANRSQPVQPATNQTPAAAGSVR